MTEGLSLDPRHTANQLFEKGFIPQQLLEKTNELNETKSSKGGKLYVAVLKVVNCFPERYSDFILLLQRSTHEKLIVLLRNTHLRLCKYSFGWHVTIVSMYVCKMGDNKTHLTCLTYLITIKKQKINHNYTGDQATKERLQETNQIISSIISIASKLHFSRSSQELQRISSDITSCRVQMGLLGLTNSGKSTTLNSLIGQKFLPVAYHRQTVASVRIVHDPKYPQGKLVQKDMQKDALICSEGVRDIETHIKALDDDFRDNSTVDSEVILHVPFHFLREKAMTLEIFDTPGTGEDNFSNASIIVNTVMNNFAAIVLTIAADDVSKKEVTDLTKKIRSVHPYLMEARSRLLVLINKYDLCFKPNQKGCLTPDELKAKVAKEIEVPKEQIILFSAESALEARKWKHDPSSVDDLTYTEVYCKLCRSPEKEAVRPLKEFTAQSNYENVRKMADVLERFSGIQEVESKLFWKLCINGQEILLQSAVDDSIREVNKLKSATDEKISGIHLIEGHCSIIRGLLTTVLNELEDQLALKRSNLEHSVNEAVISRMGYFQRKSERKNEITQQILSARNGIKEIGKEKLAEAWRESIEIIKSKLPEVLMQLLQKLEIPDNFSKFLDFKSINVSSLVDTLSFPEVHQPTLDQLPDIMIRDSAIQTHILSHTKTRPKIVHVKMRVGKTWLGKAIKKKLPQTVNENYTEFSVKIDDCRSAFKRFASHLATHIRTSFEQILREMCDVLSQSLLDLYEQEIDKMKQELKLNVTNLSDMTREVADLKAIHSELEEAELKLLKFVPKPIHSQDGYSLSGENLHSLLMCI